MWIGLVVHVCRVILLLADRAEPNQRAVHYTQRANSSNRLSSPMAVPTRRAVKTAQFLRLTVVGVRNVMCNPHVYINPIAACNDKYINSTTITLDLFTCRHLNTDPKHVIDSYVLPSIQCSIVRIDIVAVRLVERRGEGGGRGAGQFPTYRVGLLQVAERKDKDYAVLQIRGYSCSRLGH
jgi:hypothetical protein